VQLFDFERDFADSLEFIPMVVRFKLDRCGIKLSLPQWSRLTHQERAQLVTQPCDAPDEVRVYRNALVDMIVVDARDTISEIQIDAAPAWQNAAEVPESLARYARSVAMDPPSSLQWAALTPLQRFTLLKLSREGHENRNFLPAMREFGLVESRDDTI
jgi:hypothetical protein